MPTFSFNPLLYETNTVFFPSLEVHYIGCFYIDSITDIQNLVNKEILLWYWL